jgi:hypothetical protein
VSSLILFSKPINFPVNSISKRFTFWEKVSDGAHDEDSPYFFFDQIKFEASEKGKMIKRKI